MPTFFRMTTKPSYRHNVTQRYHKATENLKRNIRDQIRSLMRRYVDYAKDEAPTGKTGKFKRGIGFRTYERGDIVVGTVHMPQPLGRYITEGTKPHWIQAKNRKALSFFWPKVGMRTIVPRRGGFKTHVRNDVFWIGKGGVNHPGTKANPFHERAYRRWRPLAQQAMRRVTHNWQADFTG